MVVLAGTVAADPVQRRMLRSRSLQPRRAHLSGTPGLAADGHLALDLSGLRDGWKADPPLWEGVTPRTYDFATEEGVFPARWVRTDTP